MVQQQEQRPRLPLSPKHQNSGNNKPLFSSSLNRNRASGRSLTETRSNNNNNNNDNNNNNNTATTSKSSDTTPKKNTQFTMGPTMLAVIIDLSCILYAVDKNRIIMDEMVDAVAALKKHKRLVKFVANTTTRTQSDILKQLIQLGFDDITKDDIITTVVATKSLLRKKKFRPYYLMMDEKMTSELEQQDEKQRENTNNNNHKKNYNCVVIGTSPSCNMNHKTMDKAFHILQKYPKNLFSLCNNDYVGGDGSAHSINNHKDHLVPNSISLGPNIYCKTLESAVNRHNDNVNNNSNINEEYEYDYETKPTPSCETTYMDNFSMTFFEHARIHDIPLKQTCFIGCGDIHAGITSARESGFGITLFVKNIGGSGSGSGGRSSIGSTSYKDLLLEDSPSENGPSKICMSTVEAMNFLLSKERARAKKVMLGRNKKGTAAAGSAVSSAAAGGVRPTTVSAQKV